MKLSTESYKGVRDFYPEDMFVQKYIFERMRKAVEKFGYVEYGASVLEPAELYRAKSGEEIVNEQTYTFTDRGDREVTLRPEMTPTVARMVAAKRCELAFPLRWYSIPNLFRYEKPQRGRTREHWQLNVDLFGAENIEADIEVVSVAHEIMHSFGAKDGDFEIRINNVKMLEEQALKYNLTPEKSKDLRLVIDKKGKIPNDEFQQKINAIVGGNFEFNKSPSKDVEDVILFFEKNGIKNVVFDPSIVRGFDYYTGMVFEVYDTNSENRRALFGGGRYDDLTALFGGDKVPAVGFGAGDVTMRDFMETHGLLPTYKSSAKLYVAVQDETCRESAEQLVALLRGHNVDVILDISHKKLGDQIKTADRQKIPFVTAVGAEEVKSSAYRVKNLADGLEKILKAEEIPEFLKVQLAI